MYIVDLAKDKSKDKDKLEEEITISRRHTLIILYSSSLPSPLDSKTELVQNPRLNQVSLFYLTFSL
jgi:hypothetical protein